ncbi:lipase family protein [Rhodococcus sp. 1168]|uniref:lipase family protein n=1 Tax=Rhodococcus sp. 1168 TaxID=2018041 RepID=UPI000A0E2C3F|nr:lipase family protein [Rhodococcus sp. 1168]ORI20279.1 lipase [Rhodococcus sp. 1168]
MSIDRDSGSMPWSAEESPRPRRAVRPVDDAFYIPPAGFEITEPGTILRTREVGVALFGRITQQVDAWQLLYRTNDLDGRPQASVTTVLLPRGKSVGDMPLLSYQCAIDAVSDSCFPSYALQKGAKAWGAVPQFEFVLILHALRRGWAVSIPDHEGPHGHWGSPREPGFCTLDAVRAALSFSPLALRSNSPVGLWGYSGGGLASSWAAEMAPEYAPEINLLGAALGSPVGDPASAFIRLNATLHAGLPTLVVAGLRRTYPDLDRFIRQHVSPAGLELLDSVNELTTVSAVRRLARHDLDEYIDMPLADLLASPELLDIFQAIQPGKTAPTVPMLVVQAVHDQIIAVDDVDGQVDRYLDHGAHVTYLRDRLSEHLSLHPLSAPLTLDWLEDRFAGRPVPPTGVTTVWSTAFSLRAAFGLLAMLWSVVLVLFGRRL